jgi:hypothetical protein
VYRLKDQVMAFKREEKGHYANKCPKGHLAFLSSRLKELQTKGDQTSDNKSFFYFSLSFNSIKIIKYIFSNDFNK